MRQNTWDQLVTWLQPNSSEPTLLTHDFQALWPSNSHSSTLLDLFIPEGWGGNITGWQNPTLSLQSQAVWNREVSEPITLVTHTCTLVTWPRYFIFNYFYNACKQSENFSFRGPLTCLLDRMKQFKTCTFLLDSWLGFNPQENSEEKSKRTKFYPPSLSQNSYVTSVSSSSSYLFSGCSNRYSWVPTSKSIRYPCSSIKVGRSVHSMFKAW